MKKELLFALLSASLVAVSSLGYVYAEEETEAETVVEAVAEDSALSDDIYSFQAELNGELYSFPMTYEDFISHGWTMKDDETTELAPNTYTWCYFEKDGLKITCDVLNLCANTLPVSSCDVTGFSVDSYAMEKAPDFSIVLPAGITYGVSTLEDIEAAYGPASDTYEGSLYTKLTYSLAVYQDVDIEVDIESGVVSAVDVRNMDETKCATASMEVEVSDEIPANVTNYKAPEAISDNFYDYAVEYAGDLYQLPCPVSVFIENGWSIVENDTEATVAGKDSGWVTLMKDNQTMRTLAKNYEGNATKIENCFVTELTADTYKTDVAMTVVNGITKGMTTAELEAALEGVEYETSDSSSFVYYNVYGQDSKMDGYQFCVKTEDDTVITVSAEYHPRTLGE